MRRRPKAPGATTLGQCQLVRVRVRVRARVWLPLTLTLTKVLHAAAFKCLGFVFTVSVGRENGPG